MEVSKKPKHHNTFTDFKNTHFRARFSLRSIIGLQLGREIGVLYLEAYGQAGYQLD